MRLHSFLVLLVAFASHLSAAEATRKPDAIVAADGSGQYTTIRAAIDAAPQFTHAGAGHWTIFVKSGTYREIVYIQREKRFISLVGEDAEKTILTFDLYNDYPAPDGKPISTFRTPTVILDADDFTIENLTISNTAGPKKGQALAIRVDGDRAVFRRCRFLGYQDTLLVNRGRHYFEDCYIEGHVDFIFGGATAWFQRCRVHCLRDGYITASDIARDAIRAISNALTKGMDHSRPALKQDFTALTLRLKECTLIREDIELDPASELKEANRIADGLWNAATLALENDMGDEKSAAEFGGYVLDGHVRQQLEDASMASHEERIKP